MSKLILIIDDSSTNIVLAKTILEKSGFNTMSLISPLNAIETIKSSKPDLILLDIMMPDIDGITLLLKIKDQFFDIPVIMLSAKSDEESILQTKNLGACDYIIKPIEIKTLIEKVNYFTKS